MHRYEIRDSAGATLATGVMIITTTEAGERLSGYWTTPDPEWAIPTTAFRATPGEVIDALLAAVEDLDVAEIRWVWDQE